MKRIRIVGLCLVAVFALSAVAAASASAAEPAFEACIKTPKVGKSYPTGEFSNKECTASATEGKYKLEPVAEGTKFTSKSKGATFTINGKVVKCKKDANAGEFLGGRAVIEVITFSDCGVNGNKKEPCESEGAGAGTIKTEPLVGVLSYINSSETELGIAMGNFFGPSFVSYKCGAEPAVTDVGGLVVGTIKNTSKGDTITFAVNGGGQQERRAYWEEGNENPNHLYTEPTAGHQVEATFTTVDEQASKGIGAF